ncbi:MAG TPA: hypothetical protein VFG76_08145 [Candidatus Polarisedimenticolia bacterium]|nr:hypothetical protein [Candidatus Polarisedimenticolia bacterium]
MPTTRRISANLPQLLFLVALVFGLSLYANAVWLVRDPAALRYFPPFIEGVNVNDVTHLGAEYFNIGAALASGRGFSDPFATGAGPTAWMPPLYPGLLALLIATLGSRAWVAAAVVLLQNLALVLTGLVVFEAAQRTRRLLPAWSALALYAVWLCVHFFWFFQLTHDVWIIMLCIDLTLVCAWELDARGASSRRMGVWGTLGGLTFLTSPVAGFAWLVISALLALRQRIFARMLAAVLLALGICSIWIVRNAVVFDRFVFIKSNLFFDLYQANVASPDGAYDEPFLNEHPVWGVGDDAAAASFARDEMAFVDWYSYRFIHDALARPGEIRPRVWNRLLAATIRYKPYQPDYEGPRPWARTVVCALPFIFLLVLIARRAGRVGPHAAVAITIYAAYLLPYIVTAFYTRYLLPLTPVLVLFVFWGVDAVVSRGEPHDPHLGR